MASSPDHIRYRRAQESLGRGLAYHGRGQWQQAINAFKGCLTDDPGNREALYHTAICHACLGRAPESLDILRDLLARPDTDDAFRVRVLQTLGKVGIQINNYPLAAQALHQAFEITGIGGAPILNQLAAVMCKAGDLDRGFDLFLKAADAASNAPEPQTGAPKHQRPKNDGGFVLG